MVNLRLTWPGGQPYLLNSAVIESIEQSISTGITTIQTSGGGRTYECTETPEEIEQQDGAAGTPTQSAQHVGGVGDPGPVHGDGTPLEIREGGPGWASQAKSSYGDPTRAPGSYAGGDLYGESR